MVAILELLYANIILFNSFQVIASFLVSAAFDKNEKELFNEVRSGTPKIPSLLCLEMRIQICNACSVGSVVGVVCIL